MAKYSDFDRVMEAVNHSKNSAMEAENLVKHGASSKSLMSRGNFVIAFLALFVAFGGCNKQEGMNENSNLFLAEMPGSSLLNMTIDNNNVFYFVTVEIDKEAMENWPPYSNSMPCRYYLSRKKDETSNFEVLDDRFIGGNLCFDKNNQMWSWTATTIYKSEGKSYKKIIELPYDGGLFNSFAVDNDNNIWVGGWKTGLLKIDSRLNITRFDSELLSNDVQNIHVDKSNNIWIALCNRGIVKKSKDKWVVYDNVSSQNIWCLVTDKNGHLWIGTGHFNEEYQSLRRFDGTQWETINPRNDKNEHVKGTVRFLQSDGNKIYAVAEHVDVFPSGGGAQMTANELLSFDGNKWKKISEVPDDANIFDLIVDHYRQALWVITNKGIYKIPKT